MQKKDHYSYLTLIGCSLMAAFDGFDGQVLSFAAPRIAQQWAVPISAFGIVFSLSLLGLVAGSLLLAPWADRFGRSRVVLIGTGWIGLFTAITALCTSMSQLTIVRVLTGLGLGAVIPVLITIAHESAPPGRNALWVTLMISGIPAGSSIGGLLAAWALPQWGWSKFLVCMAAACFFLAVPLIIVLRTHRAASSYDNSAPMSSAGAVTRIATLFREGNAGPTLLLWVLFVCTLLVAYGLANWLPSLLERNGMAPAGAAVAASLCHLGGLIGGIALGWLVGARGLLALLTANVVAALVMLLFGATVRAPWVVYSFSFAVGFLIIGGQVCNTAVAASLYPSHIRTTGVGWAQGIGRVGAVVGPGAVGLALTFQWSAGRLFGVGAIFPLISAITIYGLSRLKSLSR